MSYGTNLTMRCDLAQGCWFYYFEVATWNGDASASVQCWVMDGAERLEWERVSKVGLRFTLTGIRTAAVGELDKGEAYQTEFALWVGPGRGAGHTCANRLRCVAVHRRAKRCWWQRQPTAPRGRRSWLPSRIRMGKTTGKTIAGATTCQFKITVNFSSRMTTAATRAMKSKIALSLCAC